MTQRKVGETPPPVQLKPGSQTWCCGVCGLPHGGYDAAMRCDAMCARGLLYEVRTHTPTRRSV